MRSVAVSGVVSACVIAACGGSSEPDAREAQRTFAAAADRTCRAAAAADVAGSTRPNTDPVALTDRVLAVRRRALGRLDDLDAPAKSAAPFRRYRDKLRRASKSVERGRDALAEGDRGGFEAARKRQRALVGAADADAAAAGLTVCARRLGPGDRQAIARVVALTADAGAARELCARFLTEGFVATRFRSRANCRREQGRTRPGASAKVTAIKGVAGLSANADAVLQAEPGQARTFHVRLLHQDGDWRLHELAPADAGSG